MPRLQPRSPDCLVTVGLTGWKIVNKSGPVAVRINLGTARRESSGVRAGVGDLVAYANGGSRAAHSALRHIQVSIRSEFQSPRIVQARGEDTDVRRRSLGARAGSPTRDKQKCNTIASYQKANRFHLSLLFQLMEVSSEPLGTHRVSQDSRTLGEKCGRSNALRLNSASLFVKRLSV